MPKLILPENAISIDGDDLLSKMLPEILAKVSNQDELSQRCEQLKDEILVFVAGHLRDFKKPESGNPLQAKNGDTIDEVLVKALDTTSKEFQRILLKLTRSNITTLKRNQKPIALVSHNESVEETPLLSFIYPKHSYTIRWSKETLKIQYQSIENSESDAIALMLCNEAFAILKASDESGYIINLLKKIPESSFEKAMRIGFVIGIASGIVGLSLTPVLFTALYPALLSGAASGIATTTVALLTLIAAIILIPVCTKHGKLSAIFKPEPSNDKSNTATTQSLDL